MSKRLFVIGSANVDFVIDVPRCPHPGESLMGTRFRMAFGGKGANQAIAAARLGADTVFQGCVGEDDHGAAIRDELERQGVDCARLMTGAEAGTGVALIMVETTGQNAIVVAPGANLHCFVDGPPDLSGFDAVITQLEIPLETVEAVLDAARTQGVLSILDAGPATDVPPSLLALADIVSPNETEAEAITGRPVSDLEQARRAADDLLSMGAKEVVLKLGERGALYAGRKEVYEPAFVVDAVDTVAAGDAFTSALALAWNEGDIAAALRFANAAGALACTVKGAQRAMPDRDAVETLLREGRTRT